MSFWKTAADEWIHKQEPPEKKKKKASLFVKRVFLWPSFSTNAVPSLSPQVQRSYSSPRAEKRTCQVLKKPLLSTNIFCLVHLYCE